MMDNIFNQIKENLIKNEISAKVKDRITTDTDSNYKNYNNYYYKIY